MGVMAKHEDAVCRGRWRLGNNCKTCRKCRETAPLMCPVCERLGDEHNWLIHDKYGFRYCPDCKGSGVSASPLYTIPVANPEYVLRGES